MTKPIPFDEIILTNPPKSPTAEWRRQRKSAQAIAQKFVDGFDTVLLADEVGMGKTYVALAAMANYLMQNRENNRKVLLITPPSSVLRVKWEQAILSFNDRYLSQEARENKGMRPIAVSSYWELLRNLKDFESQDVVRVDVEPRLCFTWCMYNWAFARGLLQQKQYRPWSLIADHHLHDSRITNFISHYSEHAIRCFLDEDYRRQSHFYQGLFKSLKSGTFDDEIRNRKEDYYGKNHVALIFKKFAGVQDSVEPNIYIIGMNALARPRIHETNNKFLSKFLLGFLLSGRHSDTWRVHAEALILANVLPDDFAVGRQNKWEHYVNSMRALSNGDFYGLRPAAESVITQPDIQVAWNTVSAEILCGDIGKAHAFFNQLGNRVFQTHVAKANIGLAVIDEVHNWKGQKLGATHFKANYAPSIRDKLIMSATPFQMEEGEMGKIFDLVQNPAGSSASVINGLFKSPSEISRCLDASAKFASAWKNVSTVPADIKRIQEIFQSCTPDGIEAITSTVAADAAKSDELRAFAARLCDYRHAIVTLEAKLGKVVIRHTKERVKRNFLIGQDFAGLGRVLKRHALYPSEGYASEGDALVNFVGMRLGQLVRREQKKSYEANARLLGGITSSTAAFRQSAGYPGESPSTRGYSDIFGRILDSRMHPKVAASVDAAFSNYKDGRKTLIFCERVATLVEIETALCKEINDFIGDPSSDAAVKRESLLKRTDFVDNLWWHSLFDALGMREKGDVLLATYLPQAKAFADSCLQLVHANPNPRRIVRLLDVFLINRAYIDGHLAGVEWHEAIGHFVTLYDLMAGPCKNGNLTLLQRYLNDDSQDRNTATRGSSEDVSEEVDDIPNENIPEQIDNVVRRQYLSRENLWMLVDDPEFHRLLWCLLDSEGAILSKRRKGEFDASAQGAMVFADILVALMAGIRKITLRADLLARYDRAGNAATPSKRIADGMRSMVIGHDESMLARVQRFLTNLLEVDGSISKADLQQSKRKSLWQGVSVGKVGSVATLDGSTPAASRTGLCAAFNSPLLPDILICTAIGSEGIDLHRHCADIIHHDLPWNPAKIEQRIGRVDRVGSLAQMSDELFINIGIPFLAHNYEKHQYQKVYSRAQKFEVLLGSPEYAAEDIEEEDFSDESQEKVIEIGGADGVGGDAILAALPDALVIALKLDLSVR